MKLIKLIAAVVMVAGGVATAQTSTYTLNPSSTVPDGSPIGLTLNTNVSGVVGAIASVTLTLDITGGFNGDLYAYLAGPGGGLTVLMNRVGVSGSSAFGYTDAGLNVTFSDAGANNIHEYQTILGYPGLLSGGTWLPDGRNIDPLSAGGTLFGTGTGADFSVFNGGNANGTWTLFVSDVSGGGVATLNSAILSITTVPEPTTMALLGTGLAGMLLIRRRRAA